MLTSRNFDNILSLNNTLGRNQPLSITVFIYFFLKIIPEVEVYQVLIKYLIILTSMGKIEYLMKYLSGTIYLIVLYLLANTAELLSRAIRLGQ